jgi:nitrate reductase NapE component
MFIFSHVVVLVLFLPSHTARRCTLLYLPQIYSFALCLWYVLSVAIIDHSTPGEETQTVIGAMFIFSHVVVLVLFLPSHTARRCTLLYLPQIYSFALCLWYVLSVGISDHLEPARWGDPNGHRGDVHFSLQFVKDPSSAFS